MIFDASAYVGPWPLWKSHAETGTELISFMDKWKIDVAAVVHTGSIFHNTQTGNEQIAKMVKAHGDKIVGVSSVNPTSVDAAKALRKCIKDDGLKGLKLFPSYHGFDFEKTTGWRPVLEEAVRLEIPILISVRLMMDWTLPVYSPRGIGIVAKEFPDADLIISGAGPYSELAESFIIMRDHDNVRFEISDLSQFLGLEGLVNDFGSDRVLLGTGLPFQYPICGVSKVTHAEISDADKKKILWENSTKLFKL